MQITIDILDDFIPNKNTKSVTGKENNEAQNTYRIDKATQMIIHTVTPKDTLQGLAFKYGVTVCKVFVILLSFFCFGFISFFVSCLY